MVTPRHRQGHVAPPPGVRIDRHRHVVRVSDINLSFLDLSDTIVEIVTYDSTTIHNTMAVADAFRMIGYPATKVRYLVNRADSQGGIEPRISNGPSAGCRSTAWSATAGSSSVEQRGRPVRARQPERPDQPGHRARVAAELVGRAASAAARAGGAADRRVRPAADRGLRLGRRRADGPSRDRPPVAGRIDDLPRRQRPRPVRRPLRRRGPRVLDRGARRARVARRQGDRRRLQHLDRRGAARPAAPATTCRCSASSGRVRRRPRSRPATVGSASSRPRPRCGPTRTSTRSRTRTRRSRSTSTRRRASCRWSRRAS